MPSGNLFSDLPDASHAEIFDILAQNQHTKIERIVSCGQTSAESAWYNQAHAEWVIVLQGFAEITLDTGAVISLKNGDYYLIPAHQKHRVTATSTEPPTVWLAVHF